VQRVNPIAGTIDLVSQIVTGLAVETLNFAIRVFRAHVWNERRLSLVVTAIQIVDFP
jgi:hypothetical protein